MGIFKYYHTPYLVIHNPKLYLTHTENKTYKYIKIKKVYLCIYLFTKMDKSPLEMQFDEYDSNHDGKVSVN